MNKRLIVKNYKNKIIGSESLFNELYDLEGYERCIVTNEIIIYSNTDPRLSRKSGNLTFKGTSPLTYKEINSKKYYLKVSYNGMIKEFGEEYSSKNIGRVFNQLNKFTKFAFQIPDNEFNKAKELGFSTPVTLDIMIKRYGEKEGTSKFEDYCNKQSYSNSFEYKKEKFNWSEEEFREFNLSRAVTLENLERKYGTKDGKLKFEEYCNKQSYSNSIDYFIEKYGKIEGTKRYLTIIKKKSQYYSNISQELFKKLNIKDSQYAIKNGEKFFKINNRRIFVDFISEELKLIIEYNGDIFHANPKMFGPNDKPHPFNNLTSKEIWEKDKSRYLILKSEGYKVITIWDTDFKLNKEKTIEYLNNIINDRRNTI
jgi:very-short-patch-repair endonuclease